MSAESGLGFGEELLTERVPWRSLAKFAAPIIEYRQSCLANLSYETNITAEQNNGDDFSGASDEFVFQSPRLFSQLIAESANLP